MLRKLLLLLTLTALMFVSQTVFADVKKPDSVTISYIEHIPPNWFRDSEGTLQGIGPDYWRLWGRKMGIKVNFVITSWQGSLDAVTNGEADFQSGMVPTDERKKLFDFADKETINTEEFLYVRRDLDISIPSQLGKIPVWTDGGISETLLKERFDGLNLLNADGYEVINEQIKNKTMDAFVMDDSIAAYNLAKFDATARYKKIYSVYRQPLYAAVAKGNSEMLKLVNEGNSKISAEEFNEIYNRYVATKIQYPEWLQRFLIIGFLGMTLAFFVIYSLLARYQIRKKTIELQDTINKEHAIRMEKERLLVHKSKMAQLGEMISSVTHQWKQPLSTINMIAEVMKDIEHEDVVDKEQIIADAKAITAQVEFMSNTMDDFAGFTSPSVRVSDFDIYSACSDAVKLVEHTLTFNEVKLEINCSEEIHIRGPRNDFIHVIINLITNSVDAFSKRKLNNRNISISISKRDDRKVLLVFRDNAGGLQGIDKEEIFEPYISTKPEESGTGIGLYLSRNILRKSFRGDIRAEDSEHGLSFYIEIKN